jgi:hypothetical protein
VDIHIQIVDINISKCPHFVDGMYERCVLIVYMYHCPTDKSIFYRTSGNLCLSFSTMSCNDASSNPSIETPQVTIFTKNKHTGHNHIEIIAGAAGGAILALLLMSLVVFLYMKKKRSKVTYTSSM